MRLYFSSWLHFNLETPVSQPLNLERRMRTSCNYSVPAGRPFAMPQNIVTHESRIGPVCRHILDSRRGALSMGSFYGWPLEIDDALPTTANGQSQSQH